MNKSSHVLSDQKRTMVFLCLVISGIASSILSTAMSTALPSLVEYFDVSTSTGQWITSAYSLVMGMALPLSAFLIVRVPTKKLYLSGIGVFIAGLFFSILTRNFAVMMLGRCLQAGGAAILQASAQVIILTVYPTQKRGAMMGTYGLATTAAPVIAPTIAGLMIDAFGWKSIFYLVLIIMAISFIFSIFVFENVLELQEKKFDVISFAESIFAFGGVTLGIGNVASYGIVSIQAGLPLLVGITSSVFFVLRQLGHDHPFLDVRILANRNYALSVISSMILYLVMMGSSIMMPLYVQTVMGYSAVISGLVTLPGSLATAVVSPFAGKLYDKVGIKKIFVAGAAAMIFSNIGMFFISMDTPLWVATAFNVVRNVAIGSLMMPLLTWGTSNVAPAKVADASSLLTSLRIIAGSIGAAVFVGIMTMVSEGTSDSYGNAAPMHGMNVSFLCMAICAVVLAAIAVFAIRTRKENCIRTCTWQ